MPHYLGNQESDSYVAVGSRRRMTTLSSPAFMADMSDLWHLHRLLCINTMTPFL